MAEQGKTTQTKISRKPAAKTDATEAKPTAPKTAAKPRRVRVIPEGVSRSAARKWACTNADCGCVIRMSPTWRTKVGKPPKCGCGSVFAPAVDLSVKS